jgi:hypothetical protein
MGKEDFDHLQFRCMWLGVYLQLLDPTPRVTQNPIGHEGVSDYCFLLPAIILLFTDQGPLALWAAFAIDTFINLTVSGVVAYLSFRYIESPLMRIKPK